jgi:hypothetical protein
LRSSRRLLLEARLLTGVVEEIEIEAVDAGGARARAGLKHKPRDVGCRNQCGQKRRQLRSRHAPRVPRVPRLPRSPHQLNRTSLQLLLSPRRGQAIRLNRTSRCRGRIQMAMALNLNEYLLFGGIGVRREEYGR